MKPQNKVKIKYHLFDIIVEVLNQGLMPVGYGDVIWDKEWKSTIYSGEKTLNEIGIYLTERGFNVDRIIQVGETNGVYDHRGRTIASINKKNWKSIKQYIFSSKNADVTGGMRHKIENALSIASKGIRTWIINGLIRDELSRTLNGKTIRGTVIG